MPRDEALELCRELGQEFKVEHIETGLADEAAACRSTGRASSSTSAAAGTFPAPATSARRSSCSRSPARIGRATPSRQQLQRLYATAFFDKKELDAHLDAARRSQAARPPRARQAAGAVHHQPDRRLGPDPLAAQGGDHPADARRLHQGRAAQAAATRRSTRRTSAASSCTRSRATSRTTATASSRRSNSRTASGTCSSR